MHRRVAIGDVPIDVVDLPTTLDMIDDFVESGAPHQIVTINLDFLAIARQQADFRRVLCEADLGLADGQPIVWLSRLYGVPMPERIAGVDLVQEACRLAAVRGYRPFLLGGRPGVADRAAAALQERHPGLEIAGTYCPPFGQLTSEQNQAMIDAVRAARPDMLFVALGAPRQDLWIAEHLDELGVPVCIGVGGAFDLVAGELSRAPRWMQQVGLEWSYRLLQEPGRLWRRYLLNDIPVALHLLRQRPKGPSLAPPPPARPRRLPVPEVAAVGGISSD